MKDKIRDHLLAALAAEETTERVAAACLVVFVLLQRAVTVRYCYLFLLNDKIARYIAAGDLPAVRAVAKMTSSSRE